MQFTVSSFVVPVRVKEGPLFDSEGVESAGLFVYGEQIIYLSSALPRRKRLHVLLHELRHAWIELVGRPRDGEDEANNVAAFTADCMRQLARQGGEAALMRLGSDGVIDHTINIGAAGVPGIGGECSVCGGTFPAHKIVTDPPEFDEDFGRLVVVRRLWCDHCSRLQQWTELASDKGLPTLCVVRGPIQVKGDAVHEFLRVHGHLYGCCVLA